MKLEIIRKANYNGKAIYSDKFTLTKELIELWVLNRVEVPDFPNLEEAKKFITAINLLTIPVSGGVSGPVGYFYDEEISPKESLGKIDIKTKDGETISVEVNKYNMWDDDQPQGNKQLRDVLREEKSEQITSNSYASYSADEKISDNTFRYSSLYVDYLIPFVSLYYLEKLGKNSIDWFDSETNEKLDITDDLDDFWSFS